MPKLARLRFVSIGHTNARMQDLTLNFCDQSGLPSDSTIWLRNGGGKSSILSLFFAMLRPNRRDFLGTRADGGERRLEQYILKTDRSVVVAEWVLDNPSSLGLDEADPMRFLTGVFYEYSVTKADTLNRLFFCGRVDPNVEETNLASIPIDTLNATGNKVRRTLSSFKQKWHEVAEANPSLRLEATDNQSTWSELLQREGLDPGLFGYQLTMNMREGGADELFRFKTPEDFVDFLLQLSVEPNKADDISSNLEAFREQLRRRKHEYMPDLDLSTGLIERLTPLVELHEKRLKTQAEAQQLSNLSSQIERSVAVNDHIFDAEMEKLGLERESTVKSRDDADEHVRLQHAYAAAMAYKLSEHDVKKNKLLVEEQERHLAEATHEVALWNAAHPYRDWDIAQKDVEALKLQLSGSQSKKAPVMEKLEGVASDLVAALKHQASRLRANQTEKRDAAEARDAESREIEQQAARCDAAASSCEAEAKSYRLNIEKRDTAYAKLINIGVLQPHETPEEARDRISAAKTGLMQKMRSNQNRRSGDDEMIDELGRNKDKLQASVATHKAELDAAKRDFDKAIAARDAIESDKTLLECLEADSISVEDLPDDTATLLARRASEIGEQCARLRTESASLERARVHLQDRGLMPPTVEVEALLAFLSTKVNAMSGWTYINEHIAGDSATKRRLIREFPAIAQGIIVPENELDRVRQALAAAPDKMPPLPISIATPSVFDTNEPANNRVYVAGPRNDAWFDKTAAANELTNLEQKLNQIDIDVKKLQAMQTNFTNSSLRFTQFRSLYPRGCFQNMRTKMTQLSTMYEDEQARLQDIVDDLRRFTEKRRNDTSVEDQLSNEIRALETSLERLQMFLDDNESGVETWTAECDRCLAEAAKHRECADELRAQADEIREDARRISKQADPYAEEARLLESEISQIRYVKKQPAPKAGAIDELRSRYKSLCEQVERELGNDELRRKLDDVETYAKKAKSNLDRCLRDGLTLDEVKFAVESLENPNDIDNHLERAEELVEVLRSRLAEANRAQGEKEADLKQKRDRWIGCGKPSLPKELETEISQASINKLMAEAQAAIERIKQFERQINEIDEKVADAKHSKDTLKKDAERLKSVLRSNADFFSRNKPSETMLFSPIEANEIGANISQLEERLANYQQVHSTLDSTRRTLVATVRKWVENDAFAALQSRIITQFKTLDPENIESSSSEYRDQLTLRVTQLQETLADIDAHRTILAKLLLTAANEGLRLLKLADSSSTVPTEIPGVGGERFLRITTKEPPSQKDKLDLIQELVDAIVDEPNLPAGIKLVQRAVRALASPFTIRVLNPATSSLQRYIEITQTARFSGGEQMTCAILLYCTLANVRARTRGMNRQPTSVLLLDNPVGRASRVSFINMQRQFASAMGIQLVYTTGLHDLDALGVIPNVIRLRNELVDRTRNHHLLENEADVNSRIDALRVARVEEHTVQDDEDQSSDQD